MIVDVSVYQGFASIEGPNVSMRSPLTSPLMAKMRGQHHARFHAEFDKTGPLELGDEVKPAKSAKSTSPSARGNRR